jgi:PTS system nitrogen regulatory IIA component
MPYSHMKLDELARHIGMDAREVRKWAERGWLPGQKIGGEWRFHRAEMLDWLQREIHTLSTENIRNLERATSTGEDEHLISGLLSTAGIDLHLPARSKSSLLRELINLAERTGLVYDSRALVESIQEREEAGSTALAGGFAFPHPRRPMPYATAEPLVCLARVPAGIPYGAPDGRTTDLFVLVVSHEDRQHLNVLARLAMMFSSDLPDRLRECDDREPVLAAVLAAESAAVASRR